jgi:AbrB family looped-hinge helix DNA binding protein
MQEAAATAYATAFPHHKDYKFHTTQYELVVQMVEVYERGQIVIPKYIRDMLKINPGTNLSVSVDAGKIILEKYDPIEELDKIRAECATYTTKELDFELARIEKKRKKELMKDVY